MAALVCPILNAYLLVLFGRIILSYFPIAPGTLFAGVQNFAYMLTEPLLGPLRRMVPALRFGGMGLDLSPIIVIIGIQILARMICG